MARVAVVTDSNSTITQAEAKELGVYIIPMPFTIDSKDYFEDINLTQEQFYDMLANDAQISTSQPSIVSLQECWDKLLKDYDEIVHIPMSSGLSSACQTAYMVASEYNGKVQVVDNQRIAITLKRSVIDALNMAEKGFGAEKIKEVLENTKFDSSIYLTIDTLKYLRKGGRITPAAAAMGTLLKIKPVLQIQGEKLDSFAKVRTIKQGKKVMVDAVYNDIDNRFKCSKDDVYIDIVYAGLDDSQAQEFKKELSDEFPHHEITISRLSLSIACHIGDKILALTCTKKLDI